MVGEYSVRGGILDVFPPEAEQPVRIEFFGDQVESMRRFDVESQRSVLQIKEAALLPLTEYPKSRELLPRACASAPASALPCPAKSFPAGSIWFRWCGRGLRSVFAICATTRSSSGTSRSRSQAPPSGSGSACSTPDKPDRISAGESVSSVGGAS